MLYVYSVTCEWDDFESDNNEKTANEKIQAQCKGNVDVKTSTNDQTINEETKRQCEGDTDVIPSSNNAEATAEK